MLALPSRNFARGNHEVEGIDAGDTDVQQGVVATRLGLPELTELWGPPRCRRIAARINSCQSREFQSEDIARKRLEEHPPLC